jgi:hypothetical protein
MVETRGRLRCWLDTSKQSDRSPGTRLRGTQDHGSITTLRERISKWVLIEILNLFQALSTVICKILLALIRHICSIKSEQLAGSASCGGFLRHKDMRS